MLMQVESRIAIGSALSPDGEEALIGVASGAVGEPGELLRISRANLDKHLIARGAGAGAWSNDGTHIAYFGRAEGMRGNPGNWSIWLYDVRLNASRIIHSGPDLAPLGLTWSPDDRTILFASGEPKSSGLFVLDVHTGEVDNLTGLGSYISPDWSQQLDLIAYQSFADDGLVSEIHIVRPDGSCDWTLPLSEDDASPSWVAGEAEIAFIGPAGLYTLDLDALAGGDLERLMCGRSG
jgi:Tol biopolymer transport system component